MAHTANVVEMRAPAESIFALASNTPRWPQFLPHYRWVTELYPSQGNRRVIEMAAHRTGIPVKWQSIQEWFPDTYRITFLHIGGITKGMDVIWKLEPQRNGITRVSILHDFDLGWPLIGGFANWVTGEQFVKYIAGRTLQRIKELVEAQHGAQ